MGRRRGRSKRVDEGDCVDCSDGFGRFVDVLEMVGRTDSETFDRVWPAVVFNFDGVDVDENANWSRTTAHAKISEIIN